MEGPNDPAAGRPDEAPAPADGALGRADDVLGGSDRLGRVLARWAADAMVDEAARERARRHWLRVQAEEESTLAGVLLDLAERERPVTLDVGGQRLRTGIVGLGADFVAGRAMGGRDVLVPLRAIDAVRSQPGADAPTGDRAPLVDVALAAVLGPVAAERPDVQVRTRSGEPVRGQLRTATSDVLRVRAEGDPPTPTWIPLAAILLVVLEP